MALEGRDARGRFVAGEWKGGPGRPRFSIVSIIKEKLAEVPEGERRTRAERLVEDYLADLEARKDGTAIRDLIDRFDGRPKQSIDVHDDREAAWFGLIQDVFGSDSKTTGDT